MKYVKIAYFDMLLFNTVYVFLCGHALQTGQDMDFAVEQNGACVRPVAPQAVLRTAAPPELALQPERACMTPRQT